MSGTELSWVFEAIKLAGPGVGLIFAVLWWLERAERIKSQGAHLKSLEGMTNMNEAWLKILGGPHPRPWWPPPPPEERGP